MKSHTLAIALVVLSAVCTAHAGTVILHDASGQVLQGSVSKPGTVSQAISTGVVCAASALVPPYNVDREAARQVEGIVQHNVFHKPQALVLLNIAGLAPEASSVSKLLKSLGDGHTVQLDVAQDDKPSSAGSMLQATSDVISANPDVTVKVLDHSALKGCNPSTCMAGHLSTAAHHCGGKLHPSQQQQQDSQARLAGSLALPGSATPLDLSEPSVRLFGMELAGLQGSSQQLLDEQQQQRQEGATDEGLSVYESTFVGLQGLASLHPPGSDAFAAAEEALVGMLGRLAGQLKQMHGDDILYQVSLLGDAPVSSGDASHLMSWKEVSRRALLQRAGATLLSVNADEAAQSKSFANKATAYSVALILIWFTFAGTYCMVAMKFKQDTLLYGRSKAD